MAGASRLLLLIASIASFTTIFGASLFCVHAARVARHCPQAKRRKKFTLLTLIVVRRRPISHTTHHVIHHPFFFTKLAAADALRGLQVSATPVPDAPKRAIPTQGPAGTRPSTSGDFFVVGAVWVTCITMVVVIAVVFIRLCPCVRSSVPQGACTPSLWTDWRSRFSEWFHCCQSRKWASVRPTCEGIRRGTRRSRWRNA
jgi:hypothetical protein